MPPPQTTRKAAEVVDVGEDVATASSLPTRAIHQTRPKGGPQRQSLRAPVVPIPQGRRPTKRDVVEVAKAEVTLYATSIINQEVARMRHVRSGTPSFRKPNVPSLCGQHPGLDHAQSARNPTNAKAPQDVRAPQSQAMDVNPVREARTRLVGVVDSSIRPEDVKEARTANSNTPHCGKRIRASRARSRLLQPVFRCSCA